MTKKAIEWFEEAIKESDEMMDSCSEMLKSELKEQKEFFAIALKALNARPTMTRIERIRSLTLEEMAKKIMDLTIDEFCKSDCPYEDGAPDAKCLKCCIRWLQEEV